MTTVHIMQFMNNLNALGMSGTDLKDMQPL